ncbi:hypothetical protein [Maribacter thermophilus]|uniref:hypothetical protein n=1 Tax=Maribacter thermophilus TaxID=1197874 RepID=UPI0006410945|nr:hypothetical protein [Maribacter thermophilus]
MKLTQDHIQKLYKFTRAHHVEHYDLQTELVDHMANGIEEEWQTNPNLSFEEALQGEFKKFGVLGFMDVVEKRQKALGKKYRSIIWRFFKEWLQLPKLLLTFSAVAIVYTILHYTSGIDVKEYVCFGMAFLLVVFSMGYLFVSRKDRKFKMAEGGKKWMLREMIYNLGNVVVYNNLVLQIGLSVQNLDRSLIDNIWFDLAYALLVVAAALTTYVVMFVIPSKAEELLEETYPEYKIA